MAHGAIFYAQKQSKGRGCLHSVDKGFTSFQHHPACVILLAALIPGCYAATAALVLGMLALAERQSGKEVIEIAINQPPRLTFQKIERSSGEQVQIAFSVDNEPEGPLTVTV